MSKPSIIPNWKYQKPSKGGYKGLKKLLKYVSYRESSDHRPLDLNDRWTDCGLGDNWREVYEKAGELSGPYVLAHHMVIAPAPDLMALVPEELRQELTREVTERTIENWFAARGLSIPQYSYVTHDRDTDDEFGLQNLHTHVFVAGTVENSLGERESHRVARQQVCTDRGGLKREDNLHHIARQEFEQLLDRTIGQEWRLLREAEPEQTTLIPDVDEDSLFVHQTRKLSFSMTALLTVSVLQSPPGHALQAIGLVPIAGVPPVLHNCVNRFAGGGTPYPPRCRGGEFNELAPQPPERLCAPCLRMARQRRGGRSPPSLKSMARHGEAWRAHPQSAISSEESNKKEEMMSDNSKSQFTNRLTVHITGAMDDRLEQIANQRDEPKAEVVRTALRVYLDEQEDLIGSRKHFSKAFQRRMDYQEWMLVVILQLVSHSFGMLLSEIAREPFDSGLLLEYALKQAKIDQDHLHTRLLEVLVGKQEPPA